VNAGWAKLVFGEYGCQRNELHHWIGPTIGPVMSDVLKIFCWQVVLQSLGAVCAIATDRP